MTKGRRPNLAVAAAYVTLSMGVTRARAQMASLPAGDAAPFGVAPVDDERVFIHGILDQFEGRIGNGSLFRWEGEAWAGTDTDRLWLRSEGEVLPDGQAADGQQDVFYDRPVTPYFDVQIGLRYDLDARPGRAWAALGVEGLAPYLVHVSATLYGSDGGHGAAKLEAYRDLVLTQEWILQPQIELNAYTRHDPAQGVASGIAGIDTGLRLRYDFSRKFSPYLGVTYARERGGTAGYQRADGGAQTGLRFTFGIRTWF